ncbi:hypothetical protein B0T14DRAFT_569976 [Immersiella caudata]|uniref:Uncharacterized protein n=1 Tax=Immersiella caudata TaxID=314043 RepID=A0AA40BUD9_9PEZI|nr:hypothetical protein B0T14DRAFT_569976 [Immersiella caudata]
MARFGTQQDDWQMTENSDSDTDAPVQATSRNAAARAAIDQTLREYNARLADATAEQDAIPRELYDKAQNCQDQLTDNERQLLLSRGDAVGRALGQPDMVGPNDVHEVMHWPPPDIARANIQRATSGQMTTTMELYEKAKRAIDNNHSIGARMNDEELRLLAQGFHAVDDLDFTSGVRMASLSKPGGSQAIALVAERMGYDLSVFHAAAMCYAQRVAPKMPLPRSSMITSSQSPASMSSVAFRSKSFVDAEKLTVGGQISFSIPLRGNQHPPSGHQSGEEEDHAMTSVSPRSEEQTDDSPERPDVITSLQLFRKDLGKEVDFEDALQQWDTLDSERQAEYETRARVANNAAQTAFQQERVEWLERMRNRY